MRRIGWMIAILVVTIILGGVAWLNLKPHPEAIPKDRAATATPTKSLVQTDAIPASRLRQLEDLLNSPQASERAKAYAPGVIREAYRANAKATSNGSIKLMSPKPTDDHNATVEVAIPDNGTRTMFAAKQDGQWFLTALKP